MSSRLLVPSKIPLLVPRSTPDSDVRYVDTADGVDSRPNNGLSRERAFKTIQKAHDDLPTGALDQGGEIKVTGVVTETDVVFSNDGIVLKGQGRNGTRWDVRGAASDIGLIIRGDRCTVRDFRFRGENATRTIGVWVDGAEQTIFDAVWWNAFGKDVTVGDTLQAGAAGLFISGGTNASQGPFSRTGTGAFADWTKLMGGGFFNCYRGMVVAGGGNGQSYGTEFRVSTENALLIRRKDLGSGAGVTWRFTDCWFVTVDDGKYLVRIEVDGSTANTNCRFTACTTEGASGEGSHHFFIEGSSNIFTAHKFFGGGDAGEGPIGINYTSLADDNHLGPYQAVGAGGFGIPSINDSGTDNRNDGRVPGPHLRSGSGTPEANVVAPIGSLFIRTDGGSSTTLYVKESGTGNTGWVAK